MYESYWHLREKPFENCCDPRYYFPAASHQAALLKLRYVIENRRGGALLAGPPGLGKTLLIRMLRESISQEYAPLVHLVFPPLAADQFLALLAGELEDLPDEPAPQVHQSIRRIEKYLQANAQQGRHAVLAVDEAHLLDDPQMLQTLRLLLNFEPGGSPGLTLLLIGQTGLIPLVERVGSLEERLGVICLLEPLSEAETCQYVEHRLRVAGADHAIFEPQALPTVHRLTGGVMRQINRLCDLALLIGYADQHTSIGSAQLESVRRELVSLVPD